MRCPSLASSSGPSPTFNLSNLPVYLSSNERDRDRLRQCWGVLDCGDCLRSQWHCGWCPLVSSLQFNFAKLRSRRSFEIIERFIRASYIVNAFRPLSYPRYLQEHDISLNYASLIKSTNILTKKDSTLSPLQYPLFPPP